MTTFRAPLPGLTFGMRLPLGLDRLMQSRRAKKAVTGDEFLLRRALVRLRALSPHLLADIGIDGIPDAALDETGDHACPPIRT